MAIESILSIFIGCLALFLSIEIARRAHLEILMQYGSFLYTRQTVYRVGEAKNRFRIRKIFNEAIGKRRRAFHWEKRKNMRGQIIGKLHFRFPALIQFPNKHHFEITKKCYF